MNFASSSIHFTTERHKTRERMILYGPAGKYGIRDKFRADLLSFRQSDLFGAYRKSKRNSEASRISDRSTSTQPVHKISDLPKQNRHRRSTNTTTYQRYASVHPSLTGSRQPEIISLIFAANMPVCPAAFQHHALLQPCCNPCFGNSLGGSL